MLFSLQSNFPLARQFTTEFFKVQIPSNAQNKDLLMQVEFSKWWKEVE